MRAIAFIKRRWKWCSVLCAITILALLHPSILRGVANGLIEDHPIENCDVLFAVSGDRNYVVAANLFAQGKVRHISLIKGTVRPLEEVRIVAPPHEIFRREIITRGVPYEAISLEPEPTDNLWDLADLVKARLAKNPTERVVILTDRYHSKRLHLVLRQNLSADEVETIFIHALPDQRFNEIDWWHNRVGIKAVMEAYLMLIYTQSAGRPRHYSSPVLPCCDEREVNHGNHKS